MIGLLWRRAPWWMASGVAALALFDLQSNGAGKALTLVAIAIGLAGVLAAPLADALLLALAVSLFPGDAALLGVVLALLYRVARNGSLGFDGSWRSMLLFGFFVCAAGAALFGLIAVEARPLQWFVWMATLGAPLLLLGAAFPRLPYPFAPLLSRFLVFVLWLQVPVCIAQLVRHGAPEPGDWFAGVWGDSNMVGLWGAVTLSVCGVRLLTGTTDVKTRWARVVACGHAATGAFLVWGASAKLYSVSIFGAAAVVTLMMVLVGAAVSRAGTVLRMSCAILLVLLTGLSAEPWVRDNFEGLISNWENSEKQILLTRMVVDVAQRYNSILGVGPGMLGSRAASAASADVLYKEPGSTLAGLLGPAPKPERWAMYGLWDAEVVQGVTDRSALLTMPFSGWGSLRAELGWPAVIVLVLYFLSLGLRMASTAAPHPGLRSIAIAAAIGCLGLLPMLFFDNILEKPHIIVPLAILVITARGIASGNKRMVAAASDRSRLLERSAEHSHASSSLSRGPL